MAKLTDIQLLLLTTAATRTDGSLLPPPDQLADLATRVRRAITSLIKQALVAEVDAGADDRVWREANGTRFGVAITDAGRALVGVEAVPPAPPKVVEPDIAQPITKIETLVMMLRAERGATLAEMTQVTGWLSHTTRAALTRLRQKGHDIEKTKRDDATCYRIKVAA